MSCISFPISHLFDKQVNKGRGSMIELVYTLVQNMYKWVIYKAKVRHYVYQLSRQKDFRIQNVWYWKRKGKRKEKYVKEKKNM